VAAGRKCFSLENRAKNIMDFRCADERGNTPINQVISESQKIDESLLTTLDLSQVCDTLI
jgi:pyrrolidone-carboxylate peptidase